jgi:hypothetical protein
MAGSALGTRQSLAVQVSELAARLRRDGVPLADMRYSDPLELAFSGMFDVRMPSVEAFPDGIERLESDPIEAHTVPAALGQSRLRYFLDGSQRTLLVWRLGLVPVTTTIAAAAILYRNDAGKVEIAPDTLRFRHAWLVPRRARQPGLDALIALIEESGGEIVDPLADLPDEAYDALAGDYGKLHQAAYVAARSVREKLEWKLLEEWDHGRVVRSEDDWLVVDGRMRFIVQNAVGLVKSFTRQQLVGGEAETVFGLAPGHRSGAFRLPSDFHRDLGLDSDIDLAPATGQYGAPTLWYLRMHNSLGQDARHALVRVEAGRDVRSAEEIDEISAWLLAERAPKAASDSRWATLLYPIHLLEEILKRRVAAHTHGWPAAR